MRRDLAADLAARFEEVNAETIVGIRALKERDHAHMHMIDAAIATGERDETLWLNGTDSRGVEMRIIILIFPYLGAANCLVPKFFKRKSILAKNWASSVFSRLPASASR